MRKFLQFELEEQESAQAAQASLRSWKMHATPHHAARMSIYVLADCFVREVSL